MDKLLQVYKRRVEQDPENIYSWVEYLRLAEELGLKEEFMLLRDYLSLLDEESLQELGIIVPLINIYGDWFLVTKATPTNRYIHRTIETSLKDDWGHFKSFYIFEMEEAETIKNNNLKHYLTHEGSYSSFYNLFQNDINEDLENYFEEQGLDETIPEYYVGDWTEPVRDWLVFTEEDRIDELVEGYPVDAYWSNSSEEVYYISPKL